MSLIWNLSYSAEVSPLKTFASKVSCGKIDASKKVILNSVYGRINVGELVALLGPSGAGKSTLINCLVYGDKFDGYQGDIYTTALEEPIRASMINQNEEEHLLPSLTVAQSLRYASRLKNPPSTPTAVHDTIVQNLILELSLTSCQNTEVERCSAGEKKRLAIGLELTPFLKKPHFLFLDEPTSGLDSYIGLKVIKLLARLAKAHNMAIVTTIHQPSYKLFMQFEKAFILSGRGDIIFNDKPNELMKMLETCGYDFGDGLHENPADAAIELASYMRRQLKEDDDFPLGYFDDSVCLIGQQDVINQSLINDQTDKNDCVSYESVCQTILENMQTKYAEFVLALQNPSPETKFVKQESGLSRDETPFSLYIFAVLLLRCAHTSILKQQKFTMIKFMLHFVVAGVLAMLYHRDIGKADSCVPTSDAHNCSCTTRQSDAPHKNVTFQFFSLLFLMFASLMPTVLTFPSEIKVAKIIKKYQCSIVLIKKLFWCEFRNGWYSSSTYYIAKTVVEIPFQLIFPSLYVYFLYWYSQQIGMDVWYEGIIGFMSTRYAHFLGVTILCCFIAQGLGFLIGILCVRSFNISIILSSSLLLFLFLFSGFFVKRVQMNESVSWITDFSFVRFGLESLLIIIYGNSRCDPPQEKFSSVILAFDLKDDDFQFNVVMLFFHLFITRLLAFIVFKKKAGSRLLPKFSKIRFVKLFRNKTIKQEELSGNVELL